MNLFCFARPFPYFAGESPRRGLKEKGGLRPGEERIVDGVEEFDRDDRQFQLRLPALELASFHRELETLDIPVCAEITFGERFALGVVVGVGAQAAE